MPRDYTTGKGQDSEPKQDFILTSRTKAWTWLDPCPFAQTLACTCVGFLSTVYIVLPCKQWSCRTCAESKIRRLAYRTRDAAPNRLLTLTTDPALWENPRACYDGTRRQIPELIKRLRNRFGAIEYLRVTELTRKGWPHYHLLVRSGFLPQKVVKSEWASLTGASIVDLRQVKQSFNAYNYLVKYLAKLHTIPWTDRHLSYSRNFFPPEEKTKPVDLDIIDRQTIPQHPMTVMWNHGEGSRWRLLAKGVFTCDRMPERSYDPAEACANDPMSWAF